MITGTATVVLMLEWKYEIAWIACAATVVGLVSFFDDRAHVPAYIRLAIHLIAAALLLSGQLDLTSIEIPGISTELALGTGMLIIALFITWNINLYNFMDGMDGIAGGMTIAGFVTLGLLGHLAGDDYYAVICWVIAAASAGFLVWNFPPARIFMGDVGSSTLGLLVAAMSLWADRADLFPLWLSVLIFSPFVVDATLTLARRTLKGERIWEAHRDHYYQRLVRAGWSHRRTVLWEYGLMVICSACALLAFHAPVVMQWSILGAMACVYIAAIVAVRRIEVRRAIGQGSEVPRSSYVEDFWMETLLGNLSCSTEVLVRISNIPSFQIQINIRVVLQYNTRH
ncbi:MAG: glycosyltransferase family 4 protein [Gammaproteobacteria bacterium]|nr:glycosyltransferase family 4 protein [Gammaproteobacteria bacterium]